MIELLREIPEIKTILVLCIGMFFGLTLPSLHTTYLEVISRILSRKKSFYVNVIGDRRVGKTALIYQLIGDTSQYPSATVGVETYRRPIYFKNEIADIIFSDGSLEGRYPSHKADGERDDILESSLLIVVVDLSGVAGSHDQYGKENDTLFSVERGHNVNREIYTTHYIKNVKGSLRNLKRVIIFFNKTDLFKGDSRDLEREKNSVLEMFIQIKGVEVTFREGSAATGIGVNDLFKDITIHFLENE